MDGAIYVFAAMLIVLYPDTGAACMQQISATGILQSTL